jgi:hypothetical protein
MDGLEAREVGSYAKGRINDATFCGFRGQFGGGGRINDATFLGAAGPHFQSQSCKPYLEAFAAHVNPPSVRASLSEPLELKRS